MTALAFLYSTAAAPLAEANFWSERRQAADARRAPAADRSSLPQYARLPAVLPELGLPSPVVMQSARLAGSVRRSALPPSIAALPAAYADVRRVHLARGSSRPPVLLIQDVHDVHSAQLNISRLLAHAAPALVALEGSTGGFGLEPFRAFRGTERHSDIADYLLRNGHLSGAEHYALISASEPVLRGAEDAALYEANVRAYRESVPARAALERELARWGAAAETRKRAAFGPELLSLDRAVAAFQSGELALPAYAESLAAALGESAAGYPELGRLRKASALERTLDFARAEAERNLVIEALTERVSREELEELVRRSLAYRLGELGYGEYYRSLEDLARRHGVALSAHPAFDAYVRYVVLAERIDGEALFREIEAAKAAAAARLARGPAQREIFAAAEDLRLLEKLSGHAFGPGEWKVFTERRDAILSIGERLSAPAAGGPLAETLRPFEDFYRAAEKRNEALVANLLRRAPADGTAALIAGGFHTPGVEELLRRRGISYVTLAPRIEAVEDGAKYLDAFTRGRTPLEDALLGEKLYLSPPAALGLELPAEFAHLRRVTETVYASLDAALAAVEAAGEALDEGAARRAAAAEQEVLRGRFPGADVNVLDVRAEGAGRFVVRLSIGGREFEYAFERRQGPAAAGEGEVLASDRVGAYSFALTRRGASLWGRIAGLTAGWSPARRLWTAGALGLAAYALLAVCLPQWASSKESVLLLAVLASVFAKPSDGAGGSERMEGLVEELRRLEARLRLGGGADKIKKQHESGKLTARARIERLVDPGSPFLETGMLVAHDLYDGQAPAAGVVTGVGRIEGRPAVIVANDATVKAGSWWPETIEKILRAQEVAIVNRLPIVYLVDSSGVNLPYQIGVFPGARGASRIFYYNSLMRKKLGIPQMAAVMGPCIAGGAYLPALSDFIVMVDKTSFMGLGGPNLVKAAIGEKVDAETLGGSVTHTEISRVAHYRAADDPAALDLIREKFKALPAPAAAPAGTAAPAKDPADLYAVLPADHTKPYRTEDVLERVFDAEGFSEFEAGTAPEVLAATARLNGRPVAVVANRRGAFQTDAGIRIGGVIYTESARKVARFTEKADREGLPIVYVQDVSGFMVGKAAEHSGIIRAGAEMVESMATVNVPKIVLTVNHASGAGYYAMASQGFEPNFTFAWPSARIGVMEGESAVQAVHGPELAALKKQNLPVPPELAEAMARTRADYEKWLGARHAAARGHVDAVIDPKATRETLTFALEAVSQGKPGNLVLDTLANRRMSLLRGPEAYEKFVAPFWESWTLGAVLNGLSFAVFAALLHVPVFAGLGHDVLGGYAVFMIVQAFWRELLAVRLYAWLHKGRREIGDAAEKIDHDSFAASAAGGLIYMLVWLSVLGQTSLPGMIFVSSAAYLFTHWVLHTGHNMRSEAKRRLSLLGAAKDAGIARVGFEAGLDLIETNVYPAGHRPANWKPSAPTVEALRERALRWLQELDSVRRSRLLEKVAGFVESNLANKLFPAGAAAVLNGLLGRDRKTSYPAGEVLAARFVEVFKPEALDAEVDRLRAAFPSLDESVTHEALFGAIDASAARLLEGVPVREDDADQVLQELRLKLYGALLSRGGAAARDVTVGLTTSRDGQQSNVGTAFTGEDQRRIIELQSELGAGIHDLETWGGAVIQTALLKSVRGDKPEDPWHNLREQTALLERKFREVLDPFESVISAEDRALLLDRYRLAVDRKLLTRPQVEALLAKYEAVPAPDRARIADRYQLRQEMLLRGQYIVGLAPYPDSVLELFVNTAFKNGVDIFRVFDAFNDTRNIVKAVGFARKAGARVQPVIHYTTDFPLGLDGYVELARELVSAGGEALDALTIKDAGGILEPDQAYALLKALRDGGLTCPIHLHTHETRGNRQLTLLEAIRGNGGKYPVVVDVGIGKDTLSAPFGQPDFRDFLRLVKGTPWGGRFDIDEAKLAGIERLIKTELMPNYPKPLSASSRDRRNAVWARMPGGMKTNFLDRQSMKVLPGYAAGLIKPKYGVDMFDARNELTADGRLFLDAFLDLIYQEMRDVTVDMGGISLVTPTSQWIGVQSFNNVMGWLQSGWLTLEKGDRAWKLVRGAGFPAERSGAYKAVVSDLSNYLLIWAQDKHLRRLYPGVDPKLAQRVFAELVRPEAKHAGPLTRALGVDEVHNHTFSKDGAINEKAVKDLLAAYDGIRAAVGKPVVDSTVLGIYETFLRQAAATPNGIAAKALEYGRFTRTVVLTVLEGDTNLNIPRTLEELRKKAAESRKKLPAMTDSDEDLLLLALFPNPDQAPHLFAERQARLAGPLSESAARELRAMGWAGRALVGAAALLGSAPAAFAQGLESAAPSEPFSWTLAAAAAALAALLAGAALWGWRRWKREPRPTPAVEPIREGDLLTLHQWLNSPTGHIRLVRSGLAGEGELSFLAKGRTYGNLRFEDLIMIRDGMPQFAFRAPEEASPADPVTWLSLADVRPLGRSPITEAAEPAEMPEQLALDIRGALRGAAREIDLGQNFGRPFHGFDRDLEKAVKRLSATENLEADVKGLLWTNGWRINRFMLELLQSEGGTTAARSVMAVDRAKLLQVFGLSGQDDRRAYEEAMGIASAYTRFVALAYILSQAFPTSNKGPQAYRSAGAGDRTFLGRLGVGYHELSHAFAALFVGVLLRPSLEGHSRIVARIGGRIGPARDAWITLGGIIPWAPLVLTALAGWLIPFLLAMIYDQFGLAAAAAVTTAALAAWTVLVLLPARTDVITNWKARRHRFSDYTRLRRDVRLLRRPRGVVWEPEDGGYSAENTNVGRLMKRLEADSYSELLEYSRAFPGVFWSEAAGPGGDLGLEWYEPYREALDLTAPDGPRWFAGGKINLYHNAVEKHLQKGTGSAEAIVWRGEDGARRRLTYAQLHEQTGRAAAAFARLGVKKGTVVGLVMSPAPESVIAMLALWKLGAVANPVFAAFGAPLTAERLKESGAEVVVTVDGVLHNGKLSRSPGADGEDAALGKDMVDQALAGAPAVRRVVVFRRLSEAQRPAADVPMIAGRDLWWDDFLSAAAGDPVPETVRTRADDPAIYHYSSGTTGAPKGLVHTHGGLSANVVKEVAYNFDVKAGDRFAGWDEAGWMMGPWKVIGVLSQRATLVMFDGSPTRPKDRLWSLIEEEGVTHFGLSPNLIRSMAADPQAAEDVRRRAFPTLRVFGSTGSPWDKTSWTWLFEKAGRGRLPIINISGGTDLYGALLANSPLTPMQPMSMWPALGARIGVFDDAGRPARDGVPGTLVWQKPYGPSQARGLVNDPGGERFRKAYFATFPGVWDHGDRVVRSGNFWHVLGRAGDSYKHNGKWVSAGEVENAALTHPAVREAVNIGVPNPATDNDLVLFAVLKDGAEPGDALAAEISQRVAAHLGKTFPVKSVHFLPALPKTQSQKNMHRLLRDAYLGNPLGDVSTLQPEAAGVLETARRLGAEALGRPAGKPSNSRLRLKFAASYAVVGLAAVIAFYLGMFTTTSVLLKIATFTAFTGVTDLMGQWMSLKPGRKIRWNQVLLATFPVGPVLGAITVYGFPISGAAASALMPFLAFGLPGVLNFLLVSVAGFIVFSALNDLFDQWVAYRRSAKRFSGSRLAAASLQEGPAMGVISWASLVLIGLVIPFGETWTSVAAQTLGTIIFMFFVRARTIFYSNFVKAVRLRDESQGAEDKEEAKDSADKQTEAFWVGRHVSVLKNFFTFGNAVLEGIFNQLFQLFYTWATNKDGFIVESEKRRRNRVYLMLYPLILLGRWTGRLARAAARRPAAVEPWRSMAGVGAERVQLSGLTFFRLPAETPRARVLVVEPLDLETLAELSDWFKGVEFDVISPESELELKDGLWKSAVHDKLKSIVSENRYDFVVGYVNAAYDEEFFRAAGLKGLVLLSTGLHNVDREAAARHGTVVTNAAGPTTGPVAEEQVAFALDAVFSGRVGDKPFEGGLTLQDAASQADPAAVSQVAWYALMKRALKLDELFAFGSSGRYARTGVGESATVYHGKLGQHPEDESITSVGVAGLDGHGMKFVETAIAHEISTIYVLKEELDAHKSARLRFVVEEVRRHSSTKNLIVRILPVGRKDFHRLSTYTVRMPGAPAGFYEKEFDVDARRVHLRDLDVLSKTLRGSTVGVLGLGRIGEAVAQRLIALGARVLVSQRGHERAQYRSKEERLRGIGVALNGLAEWLKYADKPEFVERSEIVAVSSPITAETKGWIGADELARFGRLGARGPLGLVAATQEVIDEDALARFLRARPDVQARLDVVSGEHEGDAHLRFTGDDGAPLPNVKLSGHTAAAVREMRNAKVRIAMRNLRQLIGGVAPDNPVNFGPEHFASRRPAPGSSDAVLVREAEEALGAVFDVYQAQFLGTAKRARLAFEKRSREAFQAADSERRGLFPAAVARAASEISRVLGDRSKDPALWEQLTRAFDERLSDRSEIEIAETFFRSVRGRFFPGAVTDAETFRLAFAAERARRPAEPVSVRFRLSSDRSLERVFRHFSIDLPFVDFERDVRSASVALAERLREVPGFPATAQIEMADTVFYRGRAAYLVGRVLDGERSIPLAFNLASTEEGVAIEAVFVGENAVSPVFSYTRSSFHVETTRYRELAEFLQAVMPRKKESLIYFSLGFEEHAQNKLLEGVAKKMAASRAVGQTFVKDEGPDGRALLNFSLPNMDIRFFVVRDSRTADFPGSMKDVLQRYSFVHETDRLGRLADTLTYENLRFPKGMFSPELLLELETSAAGSVLLVGNDVVLKRAFSQRKATPLPAYLKENGADSAKVRAALNDLGHLLRELAMSDILLGDLDLRNFGVMETGRVVAFNFTGIKKLTWTLSKDGAEQERLFARAFEPAGGDLLDTFRSLHPDLFDPSWWVGVGERLVAEGRIDFVPAFKQPHLLRPASRAAAGRETQAAAEAIKSVFDSYLLQFRKSAGLARLAFEKTDKALFQKTDRERAALYRASVDKAVLIVKDVLRDHVNDPAAWTAVQKEFDKRVSGRFEIDIAETFYRSVLDRFFPDTVTDVETFRQEFVAEEAVPDPTPIYKTIAFRGDMRRQVERVLTEFPVNVPYRNRREDARLAGQRIEAALARLPAAGKVKSFELARKLFYRGRAAYVVGRVRFEDGRHEPIVLSILNTGEGAIVRAVFVGQDAVSPIFSFTRSSFHVDTDRYHDLVTFLKETMPRKKESIFYFSLGFDEHAETKQLEGIAKKLRAAREAGQTLSMAAGRPGGAMTVFTMPNIDLVFKVIRDRMAFGKERTRAEVRGAHALVHGIDRLGRMVDTLIFKNLRFPADMFEPKFLEVLRQNVPESVRYDGNDVTFHEIYTQRKTVPLPVFFDLHRDDREKCLKVVSDLGYLLRELAMSNIYMGDFHMSNFGVMDSGRVVLYDFDEMEPLTSDRVSIKDLPDWLRRYADENGDGEPGMWPHMAPEELRMFLIPNDYYREFGEEHGLLLSDKWWNEVRDRLKKEHRIDFEPRYMRPYLLHPVPEEGTTRTGAYHRIAGTSLSPFAELLDRALRAAAGALRDDEESAALAFQLDRVRRGHLDWIARWTARPFIETFDRLSGLSLREPASDDPYEKSAWRIAKAFEAVLDLYQTTSLQAEAAFKNARGEDFHKADVARRDSYEGFVRQKIEEVRGLLGGRPGEEGLLKLKTAFEQVMRRHPHRRIARLFYTDVVRRLAGAAYSLEAYERLSPDFAGPAPSDGSFTRSYAVRGDLAGAVERIAREVPAGIRYADLGSDLRDTLDYIRSEIGDAADVSAVEVVSQPLYRGNNAYILARLRGEGRTVPLVMSVENSREGARLRYVYLDSDEIRNIFSYTRSSLYFSSESYEELVGFIQSLIPNKRVATVYFGIGFPELAHAEILHETAETAGEAASGPAKFAFSEGKAGALLISFDRPGSAYVLKVLRDEDKFKKGDGKISRGTVTDQYEFVHRAHRFTRILDNIEYEDIAMPKAAFSAELLAELAREAGDAVKIDGDTVVFKHLVIQRKVTPLGVYMRENGRRGGFREGELDLAALRAALSGGVEPATDLQRAVAEAVRGRLGGPARAGEADDAKLLREVNAAVYGGFGSELWRAIMKARGWGSVAGIDAAALGLSGRARELLERAVAGEELVYAAGVDDYAVLNRGVFQALFPEAARPSLEFDRDADARQRRAGEIAVDIGHLVKELAYSGLFYADLNRHNLGLLSGRVVIFDLDGFEKLTDMELGADFSLENALFADPLSGLPGALLEPMKRAHPEIFEAKWWTGVVERLKADEDGKLDFVPALKLENQVPHREQGRRGAAAAETSDAPGAEPGPAGAGAADVLAALARRIARADLSVIDPWTRRVFLEAFDVLSRLLVRPLSDDEARRIEEAVGAFSFALRQDDARPAALALPELQVAGRIGYRGLSADRTKARFSLATNAGPVLVDVQVAKDMPFGTLFADDGTHVAATIQGPPSDGAPYSVTLQPDAFENPALLYRALVEDFNEIKAMAEGLSSETAHEKFHGDLEGRSNFALDMDRQVSARDYSAWLPPLRPALAERFGAAEPGRFRAEQIRKNVSLLAALALSGEKGGYAGLGADRGEMDAFLGQLEKVSLRNLPRGKAGADEALFRRAVEDLKRASAALESRYQDDPQSLRRDYGRAAAGVALTLGAAKDVSADFGEAAEDWLVRDLLAARDLLSIEPSGAAQREAAKSLAGLGERLRRQEPAGPEKGAALNIADLRGAWGRNADYAALVGASVGRVSVDGVSDLTVLVTDEGGPALKAGLEGLLKDASGATADGLRRLIESLEDGSKVLVLTPREWKPALREGDVVDVARLLERPGLEAWRSGGQPIRIQTADPSLWWTGGLPESRQAAVEFLLWVTKDAFFRARKGDIEEYLRAVKVLDIQA